MPSAASFQKVIRLRLQGDVPAFEPGPLSHMLLMALETAGGTLSQESYNAILGVAASLKCLHFHETAADLQAGEIIRKARLGI